VRVVGPAKDLDPRAVLGVGHGDIADKDVGDDVGCRDVSGVGREPDDDVKGKGSLSP
jgi:hypothetical protein